MALKEGGALGGRDVPALLPSSRPSSSHGQDAARCRELSASRLSGRVWGGGLSLETPVGAPEAPNPPEIRLTVDGQWVLTSWPHKPRGVSQWEAPAQRPTMSYRHPNPMPLPAPNAP